MEYQVAVIVPIFNAELYLEKCLKSIMSQKKVSFVVICIDDNSSDNSKEIIKKYERENNNVVGLFNATNKGPSYSRNQGLLYLQKITTDYYMFVDADDYLAKSDFIASFVSIAKKYHSDLVCSNYAKPLMKDRVLNRLEMVDMFCDYTILGCPWGKLFATKSLSSIMFNEKLRVGEDREYVAFCLSKSKIVVTTFIKGYVYVANAFSIMHSYSKNRNDICETLHSKITIFNAISSIGIDQYLVDHFVRYFLETYRLVFFLTKSQKVKIKEEYKHLLKKYNLLGQYKPNGKHYFILKILYVYLRPFYYLSSKRVYKG